MNRLLLLFFLVTTVQLNAQKRNMELQEIFDDNDIDGLMLMYDLNEKKYFANSKNGLGRRKTPGTSFEMFNALVFYQLGIVKDSTAALKWDGKDRYFDDYQIPVWSKDTYLAEAFRNGTDWYFKKLSEDIEIDIYRKYIRKSKYGKMLSSRRSNPEFWNGGYSKVSVSLKGQIKFLRRFKAGKLPFDEQHINSVREMMLERETTNYKLYGKVGLSQTTECILCEKSDYGWYIGYVETNKNTYFFVSRIKKPLNEEREDFFTLRKKVVFEGLKEQFGLDIE